MKHKSLPFSHMPCIGDFEASGLALASYPIEVAWSLPSGDIRSRLICPDPAWGDYWDPLSEELHHISQKMLREDGIPARHIAIEMNRDLVGETLFFDGGVYDLMWLNQLYRATGVKPAFKFGEFETLLSVAGLVDSSRRAVTEQLARQDMGDVPLHRAANDVRFLQRWYIRARGGMRH